MTRQASHFKDGAVAVTAIVGSSAHRFLVYAHRSDVDTVRRHPLRSVGAVMFAGAVAASAGGFFAGFFMRRRRRWGW